MREVVITIKTVGVVDGENGYAFLRDIPGVSTYGSAKGALDTLKKRAALFLKDAVEASTNNKRHIIGTVQGTVLIIAWRYGSWGYEFAGPGRKSSGSCTVNCKTGAEAIDAARKHAADSFDGIAWEHSL